MDLPNQSGAPPGGLKEPGPRRGRALDWRQVGVLYLREIRAALRERSIVLNSILIPVFLYPFLLWAVFTGITFVEGQTSGLGSRVLVREWPKGHPGLRRSLERSEHLQLIDIKAAPIDAEKSIEAGTLDALLDFLPPSGRATTLSNNFQVRITFNESKDRSVKTHQRVIEVLDHYREEWVKREAANRNVGDVEWQGFNVSVRNVASSKQMGAFLAGLLLPLLFVVMVAVGCFYPAVDSTAGERERNTWETLMSTAAGRTSIVVSKYLYVASFGGLAGVLNTVAVGLTIQPLLSPMLARAGETLDFHVPWGALPILALAGLLLAGFIAAGMMIFACFARTFKEGQAMITPFYLLIMLPAMFLQVPGIQFSTALALVPIVNVTLMVRTAVSGTFPWLPIAITLAVSVGLIAACIRLAAFILRHEDVVSGSYKGGFLRFFKERMLAKSAARETEVSQ